MDPKVLKRLLDALRDAEVNEFSLETPEYKIALKRGAGQSLMSAPTVVAAPLPVLPSQPAVALVGLPQPAQPVADTPVAPAVVAGHTMKAPIVGTFYSSSSPDAPAFVQIGDRVEIGKVLCIIEAMKLMNEIEAETSGVVRQILVQNAQPVEYGQPLFIIE